MIYALVATLVHLLVQILKAPPAVEVVPEIVEPFDSLFRVVVRAEHRNGLYLAEPGLALENGPIELEESLLRVLGFGNL